MDSLFLLVQNLQHIGFSLWVEARTVDESHVHISLHYQDGDSFKGLIGQENIRCFRSASCAEKFIRSVFGSYA